MSDVEITFPGGKRVDATLGAHTIHTDQPIASGGQDAAPSPFELFLASLATCAGFYVLGFCQTRGISMRGIRIVQHAQSDPDGRLAQVELEILLPPEFPAKYRQAVALAAEACKVRTTLSVPPVVLIHSRFGADAQPHAA